MKRSVRLRLLLVIVLFCAAVSGTAQSDPCHRVVVPHQKPVPPPAPIQPDWVEVRIQPGAVDADGVSGIIDQWCADIGFVTTIQKGMTRLPEDGLYIYVFGTNSGYDFHIRNSDRADSYGFFAGGDPARFIFSGNPPSATEGAHMYVRHTQLNRGSSPVYAAGELEIFGGKVIWVSNESGHFRPPNDGPSLDYVLAALTEWQIPLSRVQLLKNHWDERWTNVPDQVYDPNAKPFVIAAKSDGNILGFPSEGHPVIVGMDSSEHLTFRKHLSDRWEEIPREQNVIPIQGLAVMNDGTLLGVSAGADDNGKLYTLRRPEESWTPVNNRSGQVTAIAVAPNGTIYGIGLDHFLYKRERIEDDWKNVNTNKALVAVAVSKEGNVFGIGTDKKLYGMRGSRTWNFIADPDPSQEQQNIDGNITSLAIYCDDRIHDVEKKERLVGIGSGSRLWIRVAPSLSGSRPKNWSCR